jgi:hypothetical protein
MGKKRWNLRKLPPTPPPAMAETPFTPGTPGSPDPAEAPHPSPPADAGEAGSADPAAGNAVLDQAPVEEASVEEGGPEELAVEGWSDTPVAVSTEEAIARPGSTPPVAGMGGGETGGASDGPIEIGLQPATEAPEPTSATEASAPDPAAAEPAPEPEPTLSPEPPVAAVEAVVETVAEAVAMPNEPAIASTLEIPPAPGATAAEGGEFDLLIEKLRSWLDEADLAGHWQRLRGPLKGVALLLVAVLALRLYARVVGTLYAIPVVSGLLELTGLLYLIWFGSTRLVRTSERERVLADWKRRWQDFSGRA